MQTITINFDQFRIFINIDKVFAPVVDTHETHVYVCKTIIE